MTHLRGSNSLKIHRGPQGIGSRFREPWENEKMQSSIPQIPEEWKSLEICISSPEMIKVDYTTVELLLLCRQELFTWVSTRVSVQGVESLWGDCRFILADWGS